MKRYLPNPDQLGRVLALVLVVTIVAIVILASLLGIAMMADALAEILHRETTLP